MQNGNDTVVLFRVLDSCATSRKTRNVGVLLNSFTLVIVAKDAELYSCVWRSVANGISVAIAFILIPTLTVSVDTMPLSVLVCAIISTVAILPVFFMSENPPTHPSLSAATLQTTTLNGTYLSFWSSLLKVAKNRQFWILWFGFSIFVAFFDVFSTLINQIVLPFGYSNADSGIFGMVLILAGLFGAIITGPYIDKTKKHKLVLKLLTPMIAIMYIIFIFVVRPNFFAGICITTALLGIFSFGLLPVVLELGVECTYPMTPSSSTSLLWIGGQLFSIIFLFVAEALKDNSPKADPPQNFMHVLILFGVCSVITAAIVVFSYNEDNHRIDAESKISNP